MAAQKKNILFVDATPDNKVPRKIIECIAESYGYDLEPKPYTNKLSFINDIQNSPRNIDILYIAAHGNIEGILLENHEKKNREFIDWRELSDIICAAGGLTKNSTVFLACCDSGFKRAALILMTRCPTINVVAGLPCKLSIQREGLVFHTFVDQLNRSKDAYSIAEAVKASTDHNLNIFIRQEMDAELAIFHEKCPNIYMTVPEFEELINPSTATDSQDEVLEAA